MKLNKTHLILSTADLGGFRGFEIERSKLPILAGLTDSDLQCRNTAWAVVNQLRNHVALEGTAAQLRGVDCLAATLPNMGK